jgi:hypothetical protein
LTVNENYEIIDGQHRFKAAQELGLPVNIIICPGYSIKDVQRLNANQKEWKLIDYLDGFCEEGETEYGGSKKLKETPYYDFEDSLKIYLSGIDPQKQTQVKLNLINMNNDAIKGRLNKTRQAQSRFARIAVKFSGRNANGSARGWLRWFPRAAPGPARWPAWPARRHADRCGGGRRRLRPLRLRQEHLPAMHQLPRGSG